MKIEKVLNNNVIHSTNDRQQEIVAMGRGLAFQKKIGDQVELENIEKIFILEEEGMENISSLYADLDPDILEISTDIIKYAQGLLNTTLSNSIYMSLPSHIEFAIQRVKDHLDIKNPLIWEIKRFYKVEYGIGRQALALIDKKLDVRLPKDEAASIALHIVNAKQDNQDMHTTIRMTEIVQDILNIVSYHFGVTLDEDSFQYARFVTHLQYFAHRILNNERDQETEPFMFEEIKERYPDVIKSVDRINAYVIKHYQTAITDDEKVYLTIHIQRLIKK